MSSHLPRSEQDSHSHGYGSFFQAGCRKVYIVARSSDALEEAAAALNTLSTPKKHPQAEAVPVVADISSTDGCRRMADEISKTTDHVDILVANAGATFIGKLEDYTEQDFATVMNVNVNSVFFSVQKYDS